VQKLEKQLSVSANLDSFLVKLTLMVIITTPNTATQIPTFRSGLQYRMMRPVAVRFAGVAIMYLKK
jgi:hypothetical protein